MVSTYNFWLERTYQERISYNQPVGVTPVTPIMAISQSVTCEIVDLDMEMCLLMRIGCVAGCQEPVVRPCQSRLIKCISCHLIVGASKRCSRCVNNIISSTSKYK